MSVPFSLVPADNAHLEALLPLVARYQDFYRITGITDDQRRRFFLHLLASPAEARVFVALHEGAVVGFATVFFTFSGALAERIAHLGDLYVLPEHRNHGLGRKLISTVAACAQAAGIARVRWFTSSTNTTAQRLYDSLGATRNEILLYVIRSDAPASA